MGLPQQQTATRFTIDEYLAMERKAIERHEFLDGRILVMAGERPDHGIVSVNLVISLGSQLRGKPCQIRTKDTKVRSGPFLQTGQSSKGLFSYPDLVVICGEPKYHDEYTDVILNPTAILEVLSQSTEAFDRGEKCKRYQTWNPTLQDYLLISQDQPQIEHFNRQPDDTWTFARYTDLEAVVVIPSIQCTLKLADVYERVVFAEEQL